MATASNDIDDIRRKMAQIRRDLHQDVRNVVEGAEAVSDWRFYVRKYPWATVGLAAAVGYFIVPKRKRTDEIANAVAAAIPSVTALAPAPLKESKAPEKKRGLIGMAIALLAPIALRAAQNYATHFASTWIAEQQEQINAMMAAAGRTPQAGGASDTTRAAKNGPKREERGDFHDRANAGRREGSGS